MIFRHMPHGDSSPLEDVRRLVDKESVDGGRRLSACTRTFGCQQNMADTERLRGQLGAMGYCLTDLPEDADLMLINACAVREHAEDRAYGHLGEMTHWKAGRPGRILVFCGCMAQRNEVSERVRRSYPHVDILFGPQAMARFPQMLLKRLSEKRAVFDTEAVDGGADDGYGTPPMRDAPPRAWIPIMSGCDNFCSYCIVPYVRGREHSRRSETIVSEIAGLLDAGYKDFTLLGQNVNSYRDPSKPKTGLPELLREICRMDGEYWVRFMTSHPKDCTKELLLAMSELEPVARHLHLPAQSGGDSVLSAMNRGYTSAHYLELLDAARALMPDLTVTSDIIVGFPGETEEDFEDTLRLVERARFDMLFTFLYSPRAGTPAAEMPGLPQEVKQRRFERLLELQNGISHRSHAALEGTVQRVLVDGYEPKNSRPLTARTSGGRLVRLEGGSEWVGHFADAEITGYTTWNLFGRLG